MGKNILLGVTAGIAAYKAIILARLLVQDGHQVQVVMTESAKEFVGELSFTAVTNRQVKSLLFNNQTDDVMEHITLARWADLILIAPASANFMAKLSHGFADDLLNCLCLASGTAIMIAPAMNKQMWLAPATQANVKLLQDRQVMIIGPDSGEQACGEVGAGRMVEPVTIVAEIKCFFAKSETSNYHSKNVTGQKWLVTAGPTYEDIDVVRYITNRSSGKMGLAIVKTLMGLGAEVFLICGPISLELPNNCHVYAVRSGKEMFATTKELIDKHQFDGFIATAAVADYTPKTVATSKIKKSAVAFISKIKFEQNPDILHWVGHLTTSRPKIVVGFAAETDNAKKNAIAKFRQKNIDWICINAVGPTHGMEVDDNSLILYSATREINLGLMSKQEIAYKMLNYILQLDENGISG